MSVQTEISRLESAKAAIKTAIEGKGVTVPEATMLDGMAALIATIESGGDGLIMASGEYTPAENQNEAIIEHGLGKEPALFMIFTKPIYLTGRSYLWFACGFAQSKAFNPDGQHTCVIAVSGHLSYSSEIGSTTNAMSNSSAGSYLIYPKTDTITYKHYSLSLKAGTEYVWYAVA